MIFLTVTVCRWTDWCSGNTAELYLCGTQFESWKNLPIVRFPSLNPDICQGTSDKSHLLMSNYLQISNFIDMTVKFYDLYSLPNIIWIITSRKRRYARHVQQWQSEEVYHILTGRYKVKTPLGRCSHRQHNVKMDHQEVRWGRHRLGWSGWG